MISARQKKYKKENIEDILALTPMQEGMLFLHLHAPDVDMYFEQLCLNVSGKLDRKTFEEAWNAVVENNEMLRTCFSWEKAMQPIQVVLKCYALLVRYTDLSGGQRGRRQERLEDIKVKDRKEGFDLRHVPFRVTLCKLEEDNYEIIISHHHILYDGWSTAIIAWEFFSAYGSLISGRGPERSRKTKFKEYLRWLQDRDREKEKVYWQEYLAGLDSFPALSVKRLGGKQIQEVGTFSARLESKRRRRLEDFASIHRLTLSCLFYGAWGILLQKYNNTPDVLFGTTVSGRPAKLKGVEEMVGLFINTVPLRVQNRPGEKVVDMLGRLNRELQAREPFEAAPLVKIKEYARLGHPGRDELFDTIVVIENYPLEDKLFPQGSTLKVNSHSVFEMTNYDLNLAVNMGQEIVISFIYNSNRLAPGVLEQLARHYEFILDELLLCPGKETGEIDMLPQGDREQILYDFNRREKDYPDNLTIQGLFEACCRKSPGRIALVGKGSRPGQGAGPSYTIHLTYRVLDEQAANLAHRVRARGGGPGSIVALAVHRSLEMVFGILGVLKSGAAYLPLDPQAPGRRIDYMLADSGAALLVTGRYLALAGKVYKERPAGGSDRDILLINEPPSGDPGISSGPSLHAADDPAYVIYTSGSTGNPKGVLVEHRNFCPLVHWGYETMGIGPGDRVVQNLSYYFDWSVWEIFITLTGGAALFLVSRETTLDPGAYVRFLISESITVLHMTPTQFQSISHGGLGIGSLKHLAIGAEKLTFGLAARAFAYVSPGCRVYNMYGPTEVTIMSAVLEICRDRESYYKELSSIPIGGPISNLELYILDRQQCTCPLFVPGELHIGGRGVARGYLNNPGLTAEKFVDDIYADPISPAEKMYRTGDLVRWLPDGTVEFLGRVDQQVKIRGFRIEPAEIENRLLEHVNVKEAQVIPVEDRCGEKHLCAYIVPGAPDRQTSGGLGDILREYLSQTLPAYMIPSHFIPIEEMPLTANGKIDIAALPGPGFYSGSAARSPADTPLEHKLTDLWSRILAIAVEDFGIDDDFFALGGHSLKATRLLSLIHKEFKVEISVSDIFSGPTIRKLAAFIERQTRGTYLSLAPLEKKEYYPLSPGQKQIYLSQQMENEGPLYNITGVLQAAGKVDGRKLEQAFLGLIKRHESLRTSFTILGEEPVQRVHDPGEIEFKIGYDIPGPPHPVDIAEPGEPGNFADYGGPAKLAGLLVRPFDLSGAPLLRVWLITTGEEQYVLVVDMHHIISDGSSVAIFIEEFLTLYRGEEPPPLTIQYKDYAGWMLKELEGEALQAQETFWLEQFSGEIPRLNLPCDFVRPTARSFDGNTLSFELGAEDVNHLKALALEKESTLFTVLLAVFDIFLYKLSGQETIAVGTVAAGRGHADLEPCIGMFVNTLVLKQHLMGSKRVGDFIREVRDHALKVQENQDYPFGDLVEKVDKNRDAGRNPLFDVMFALQNMPVSRVDIPGLRVSPIDYDGVLSKLDLTFICREHGSGLHFKAEYCTRLFKMRTLERFIDYFKNAAAFVARHPGARIADVEIISDEEKREILCDFSGLESAFPGDKTIQQLFMEQAAAAPDRIALRGPGSGYGQGWETDEPGRFIQGEANHLTYKELNRVSGRAASFLSGKGARANCLIALLAERSQEMILGILGILKTGSGYVPLDPGAPGRRTAYIIKDCGVHMVLADRGVYERYPDRERLEALKNIEFLEDSIKEETRQPGPFPAVHAPNAFAYVIFTSGSTGIPKGVGITHANFCPLMHWGYRWMGIVPGDRVVQNLSFYFDWSVWEIFIALTSGAALFPVPRETTLDPGAYVRFLIRESITVLHMTPTQFQSIISHADKMESLKHLAIGAEKLTFDLAARAFASVLPDCRVYNMYGPTEATIMSAVLEISREGLRQYENLSSIPIGSPLANLRLLVLDRDGGLCPCCVPGELFISGDGVSRGYLNNPELTAEKFIENPYARPDTPAENMMYSTGDRVRWLPGGNIEFLGRIDMQVKIRGFRIELGEIESRLIAHKGVEEALVMVRSTPQGENYLCAYIVTGPGLSRDPGAPGAVGPTDLKSYLSAHLPAYMVPAHFFFLEKFPMSANGKVDRKALPEPASGLSPNYIPPENPVQEKLCAIWSEVLKVERVGIESDFFELGGHSLKAADVANKVHQEFGTRLPIRDLFHFPTISLLAERIRDSQGETFSRIPGLPDRPYYELSYSQKRLWYIIKLEAGSSAFNIPARITIDEHLDEKVVNMVFMSLAARHESLRTSFREINKEPVQVIAPVGDFKPDLHLFDVSRLGSGELDKARARLYEEEKDHVFDLEKGPLFRVKLVKWADRAFDLVINMHHIVSDGWSIEILKQEFFRLYESCKEGKACAMEPLKVQYKDFADWQNRLLAKEEELGKAKEFWAHYLSGTLPVLDLPYDFPPTPSGEKKSAAYCLVIDEDTGDGLRFLARDRGGSLFTALLAGFMIMLSQVTGQREMIVAMPAAARRHENVRHIVGMFVNTLLLRSRVNPGDIFGDFFRDLQHNMFQVLEYQDYPLELVFGELKMKYPEVKVFFNMVNTIDMQHERIEESNGYHIEEVQDTKFDMVFYLTEYGSAIEVSCHYYKELFLPETVERLMHFYVKILKRICREPGKRVLDYTFSGKKRRLNSANLRKTVGSIARP